MPSTTIELDAVLFDMDGTLIDSTPAVNAVWRAFGAKWNVDAEDIISSSHGVQTHMTFSRVIPQVPEDERKALVRAFEGDIIPTSNQLKAEGKEGLKVLPGVKSLLEQLRSGPEGRWAIVTSATGDYAYPALASCSDGLGPLPTNPKHVITADDVSRGKPNPDPYQMGASRLGLDISKCLVVEDAPSGSRSGRAAGCKVLAVGTGHDIEALKATNPDFYVPDLSRVSAEWREGGRLFVTIQHD